MAGLTIDNPVTLSEALQSNNVVPGDSLKLLPGTYTGDFVSRLSGLSDYPITISPLTPGTVIIDGSLSITAGGYITISGIEFTRSDWTTRTPATWREVPSNLYIIRPGIKIRNCIIHDGSQCIVAYGGGLVELYGCLIYNGGQAPLDAGPSGHSIYTHNNPGTYSLIENNIWLGSFNYGFHAHSSGANNIDNYDLKDNIFGKCNGKHTFGNDSGLDTKVRNIVFRNNENMNTWWWFNRWTTPVADDISLSGNWFDGSNVYSEGCCQFKMFKTINSTNNTFVYPGQLVILKCPDPITNYSIDNNTYYGAGSGAFSLQKPGEAGYTTVAWEQWKNALSGLDANSTFLTNTPANRIRLIPNIYDSSRAHLAIYNYDLSNNVAVDVSSIFQNDEVIKVHNSQDYFNDIQILTVTSGSITIDMRAEVHTAIKPIGHSTAIDQLMLPKYGAFVLERT